MSITSKIEDFTDTFKSNDSNISTAQRIVSVATGAFMLISAIRNLNKPSVSTIAKAIGAGAIIYRGVTGYCPVTDAIVKK